MELVAAQKRRCALRLAVALVGAFAALCGVMLFFRHLLPGIPQPYRAILVFFMQWIPAAPAFFLALLDKEKMRDYGLAAHRLGAQIGAGLLLAGVMSLVLTVIPIVLGFRSLVGSTSYTQPWQVAYEFAYCILGIALAEEFLFRGYLFNKLEALSGSRALAIGASSALFGVYHLFSGNLIQVVGTGLIGLFLCLCRERIKNCTLLSLILAHGVYDALITLWVFVL